MIRVAYFPDSFHEVNGVAHTSRHFEAFARRRGLPFLCVRAGKRRERLETTGSVTTLELSKGFWSPPLERDLRFDPLWVRHAPAIARAVKEFRPDVIHITGPSEMGWLGYRVAKHYRIPLAASWHTNVHEYAGRRSRWALDWMPKAIANRGVRTIEQFALWRMVRFYRRAEVLFAPNAELCGMLAARTGRACHLMQRGIDAKLFSPERRERASGDQGMVLGFVGRLSVEKNVALLARVQRELEAAGLRDFRFRIVGQGDEAGWLRRNLPRAEFTGVLRGEALARAYAEMDVFVFPSHTDTFGNVVLEALASGVPAVVTPDGGPMSLVEDGRTGFVARDEEFSGAIARMMRDAALRAEMSARARAYALGAGWDAVFEKVYAGYQPLVGGTAKAA